MATTRSRPTESYVWCDSHCQIHPKAQDYFQDDSEFCNPENWRPVYVQSDDPNEDF